MISIFFSYFIARWIAKPVNQLENAFGEAASSQEISNNTSEVATVIDEVAAIANNQAELAQKLNKLINKFKI